jgi:hypothetical protein
LPEDDGGALGGAGVDRPSHLPRTPLIKPRARAGVPLSAPRSLSSTADAAGAMRPARRCTVPVRAPPVTGSDRLGRRRGGGEGRVGQLVNVLRLPRRSLDTIGLVSALQGGGRGQPVQRRIAEPPAGKRSARPPWPAAARAPLVRKTLPKSEKRQSKEEKSGRGKRLTGGLTRREKQTRSALQSASQERENISLSRRARLLRTKFSGLVSRPDTGRGEDRAG